MYTKAAEQMEMLYREGSDRRGGPKEAPPRAAVVSTVVMSLCETVM